jgi:hypothetical protein
VVPGGTGEGRADLGLLQRVVRRSEEVAEEDAALEQALSDLDESKAFWLRQPASAAEAQHLAALGTALARQPTRAQPDLAAEPLDSSEACERACDRALAVEDEGGRPAGARVCERCSRAALEDGLWLVALPGHAEPHRAHRARSLRDPLDGVRDRTVLRDQAAGTAAQEHGCAGGDPEHDEHDRRAAAAQPGDDEPQGVQEGPQPVHAAVRSTRSAATDSTPSRRPTSS